MTVKYIYIASVFIVASFMVSASVAQANPVAERQDLMKSVGKSMKAIGGMMADFYDAKVAEDNMKVINSVPDKVKDLFPEGSDKDPKSAATAKVWSDRAGFDKIMAQLKVDSAAAVVVAQKGEAGEAEFRAAFGKVAGNCKNCHQSFKVKK